MRGDGDSRTSGVPEKGCCRGGLSGGGTAAALHPSQLNGLPGADDRGGAAEPRNNPGLEFAPLVCRAAAAGGECGFLA